MKPLLLLVIAVLLLVTGSFGLPIGNPHHEPEEDEMMEIEEPMMHHDPNTTHPPGHGGHGGHKMWFHVGSHATILFEAWHTMNWQQMLGSCVGLAVISILYEGLKIWRVFLFNKMRQNTSRAKVDITSSSGMIMADKNPQPARLTILSAAHWAQVPHHFLQVWVGYCLMLVFMTYNVWLCLAVSIGSCIGYILFGWIQNTGSASGEHCN